MIEHVVYFAALMAPEIADAASDAAGSMVERTGRRLAVGLCDEIETRIQLGSSSAIGALVGAVANSSNTLSSLVQSIAEPVLVKTLDGEGIAMVDKRELALLREMAAKLARGEDASEMLDKLKAYLGKKAAG